MTWIVYGHIAPNIRLGGRRYICYGVIYCAMEDYGFLCCAKLISPNRWCEWWNQCRLSSGLDSFQEFSLYACVCEDHAPFVPFSRMLGFSGSIDYFSLVKDASTDNIQDVFSLGSGLMWNDTAVCGGMMGLKKYARDSFNKWNYLKSDYDTLFSASLIWWKCVYTLLMTRVHTNHWYTVSWKYSFTGSNEALCIHPKALDMYAKARMWDPGPSSWISCRLILLNLIILLMLVLRRHRIMWWWWKYSINHLRQGPWKNHYKIEITKFMSILSFCSVPRIIRLVDFVICYWFQVIFLYVSCG